MQLSHFGKLTEEGDPSNLTYMSLPDLLEEADDMDASDC